MESQVRLLEEDKPLTRFLWRDMKTTEPPTIYEWQVLPFGTTSSPCCATYALQVHVKRHTPEGDERRNSIERCFYVDNWLQSFPSESEAGGRWMPSTNCYWKVGSNLGNLLVITPQS